MLESTVIRSKGGQIVRIPGGRKTKKKKKEKRPSPMWLQVKCEMRRHGKIDATEFRNAEVEQGEAPSYQRGFADFCGNSTGAGLCQTIVDRR